jgi:hypothetical protein
MGIFGFHFVYHGDWADPEIIWHGHSMNMYAVETPMWELYTDRCRETNAETTEEGFVTFCRTERHRLREYAQGAIDAGLAKRVRGIRFGYSLFSHDAPCMRVYPAT